MKTSRTADLSYSRGTHAQVETGVGDNWKLTRWRGRECSLHPESNVQKTWRQEHSTRSAAARKLMGALVKGHETTLP